MKRFPHHRFFLWLAASLTVVVFAFDSLMEANVAAAIPYVLVIWLAFAAGNSRGVWIVAIVCSLLTFVSLYLSSPGGESWIVVTNCGLALLVIWVTAHLSHRIPRILADQTRRAEVAEQSAADIARKREEEQLRSEALASIMEDLRAQRQKLAASEQRFRATIEWAPTAMIMIDRTGRIVLVNAETEKIFGYSRNELAGQQIEQLVPERYRSKHSNYRSDFFMHPEARRMGAGRELFGLRKDGSEFPVEIGLNPVTTEEGQFVLSAIVDITARKQLEHRMRQANEALEQSNRELEQFASVASHDLREPLRKISTYAQLLQEECDQNLNEAGKEYLRVVIDGADRLSALVSDLLSLSRITTRGKNLAPTDANDCLRAAIENLELSIEESGAHITSDRLPIVMADEGQLILVFQNLVGNAIKYRGKSAPEIHVGGRNLGNKFECFVRDDGIGVDPKYFERIFEIFQRLHNRREYGGTGIGLTICKRIVERFGGKIWIASTPGAGSTFYFTINTASKTRGQGVSSKELAAFGASH